MRSKIVRIHEDLDCQIRSLAKKNRIGYTEASREMAKASKKLQGKAFKMEEVLKF